MTRNRTEEAEFLISYLALSAVSPRNKAKQSSILPFPRPSASSAWNELPVPTQTREWLARAGIPFVQMIQQIVERQHVARLVAVLAEHHVRPPLHSNGRVDLAVESEPLAADRVPQDALVSRARQDALRKEIVPLHQAPHAVISGGPIVELQE